MPAVSNACSIAMLGKRDPWLHHASRIESGALRVEVEAGFAALVERELARVAERLDAGFQQQRLMPLARFAAAQVPATLPALLDWTACLDGRIDELAQWQGLAALLLTSSGTFRKRLDKNIGFPTDKEASRTRKRWANCSPNWAACPAWRRWPSSASCRRVS